MKKRPTQPPLASAGSPRPAQPSSVYAEDFSLLVLQKYRLRITRTRLHVLN